MTRKLLLLCLLIPIGFCASAQGLYKEGFVLKSPFDTLYGQIRYISYNQAAKRCVLKSELGDEQEFLPGDIYGYGIENELLFHSKNIPEVGERFVELLYQGTVNLYAFRDTYQRNFFYLENQDLGEFRALTEKVITRRWGRRRQVIKSYIDVLKLMLPEHELVAEEIDRVSLSARGLSDLLIAYDERYAQTQGISYVGLRKNTPTRLSLLGGFEHSGLKLNGHDGRATSRSAMAGLRIEKEISRNTGRFFLHADLLVSDHNYSGAYTTAQVVNTPNDVITNNINITARASFIGVSGQIDYATRLELDRILITVPVAIKYKIPGEHFNVTFGGGLEFQWATSDNILVDGRILEDEVVVFNSVSEEFANPFRVGMNIGMGISYNAKRTIFLDFRHSPAFFDQGVLNYDYTRLTLGVKLSKND